MRERHSIPIAARRRSSRHRWPPRVDRWLSAMTPNGQKREIPDSLNCSSIQLTMVSPSAKVELPIAVSQGFMRILALALALIFPGPLRAESAVVSLADGRDGSILFASSTPTGLNAYLSA